MRTMDEGVSVINEDDEGDTIHVIRKNNPAVLLNLRFPEEDITQTKHEKPQKTVL